MHSSPTLLIKRGLIVLGVAGLVGALVWTLWPKPVLVDVAEVRRGSPHRHRGRGGQDPHQGRLHRVGADHGQAGAPVARGGRPRQERRDHRRHHRADGAGVPRCPRHPRAGSAARSRQGRVALAEAEINQAAAELRVRPKRTRTRAVPHQDQDHFRARPGARAHRRRYQASRP